MPRHVSNNPPDFLGRTGNRPSYIIDHDPVHQLLNHHFPFVCVAARHSSRVDGPGASTPRIWTIYSSRRFGAVSPQNELARPKPERRRIASVGSPLTLGCWSPLSRADGCRSTAQVIFFHNRLRSEAYIAAVSTTRPETASNRADADCRVKSQR
jgi:hypothetical protein